MEEAYVFATHSGDFGKWAYHLNGTLKYGESKGTTKDQMYLMAILQILRNDDVGDEVTIHIPDDRTYKRLIGEYEKKSGIITDYMNEIAWATGRKLITYNFVPEKEIMSFPFYIAVQRMFQGRQGLYFDLDGNDSIPFEVEDLFNNNKLEGYLCKIADLRYGMLYIEFVNEEYCPQWIWATPKIKYPFGMDGRYYKYDGIDRIEIYEKLDGTNILAYIYEDKDGNRYVTYKTRLTPVVRDGKWGRFEKMWRDILEWYPTIPDFCLENDCNAAFEMYGKRNPILIKYDIALDIGLLFCRTQDGKIYPPSEYDFKKYGLKSAGLWKTLYDTENFEREYKKAVKELNAQLVVTEVPDANDIVEGWEGAIWYAVKENEVILLKCKPDYVKDIHFLAIAGIPKHSIYITCLNVFESKEDPDISDIIELLREEFDEEMIQRKMDSIERIYKHVYEQMILRHEVIDEYERHPEFDIVADKKTVMRYFSKIYEREMMSRVHAILWDEFGL